jgi:hypothetical protein
MPEHKGPDLQQDREMAKFDYITYMEHFMGGAPPVNGGKVNGVGE